jgi:hypothetical protein
MERIQAEKMSILRRCKMEEINIPFSNGASLNDISLDELDVSRSKNDMQLDEDLNIDFSILKKESKQVINLNPSINRNSRPTMRLSFVRMFVLYL